MALSRLILAAWTALVLTACSTVGIGPGPGGNSLDPLRDDIASMIIAFDLPRGLGRLLVECAAGVEGRIP